MSNSYYNHGSYPTTGAPGASASLRSELDSITSGFNLLPTISGNGSKAVIVNSGATALSVTTGTLALAGNFATTGAYNTTLIQGATTSLTLPLVSGTLATLAGTEEFTNKTLTSAVAKGTWTASGTWTLPALTLGGAITYGGVTLSNAVTGTNNMVLSASPTLTGTIAAASQTLSGTFGVTGVATFTAQPIMSSLTASKPVFTDASKGLTSTGTLAYDQGGTGQTSYAAGDIIYASGVNTLTKLAIGTTGQHLIVSGGVPSWSTDATIGTVTSVGWTGGIVSVATATTTPAFTIAGTSGGVPYFDSGTTWATSAALAANALVLGGGAGAAPSTTTTGTGVVTALGVNTGTAGAFVVNGGALGTPSSGTVTNLTGTASININGTVGATTPAAGSFTTLSASSTSTMAAINASGTVAMAGAATVGTTLGVTGTSTMAAINASGLVTGNAGLKINLDANSFQLVGKFQNNNAGTGTSAVVLSSDSTYYKAGLALQRADANGAGTLYLLNRASNDAANVAITDVVMQFSQAGAATIPGTLGVTGTSTMAAINASGTVAMAGAATVGTTLGVTGASTLTGNVSFRTMTSTNLIAHPLITLDTSGTGQNLTLDVNDSGSLARVGPNSNTQLDIITANTARITIAGTGAVTIPGTTSFSAGLINSGTTVARFQSTTSGAPAGSTGSGVEIYAGNIFSYNRTTSVFVPLTIEASALTVNAPISIAGAAAFTSGTDTDVLITTLSSFPAYNVISLNGFYAASTMLGWYGGATGDNNIYATVPTGGSFYMGVNASTSEFRLQSTSLLLGVPVSITAANPGGWATGFRTVVDNNGGEARIYSYGADATTRGSFNFYSLEADGGNNGSVLSIAIGGVVTIPNDLILTTSGQLKVVSTATATGTAVVHNANGYYYDLTSSRRFKENFRAIPNDRAALDRFLKLTPELFDVKDGIDKDVINFIAEDAADAEKDGLLSLTNYNGDGEAQSLRDYGFSAYQQLVLQDHEARLAALQAEFQSYKSSHP